MKNIHAFVSVKKTFVHSRQYKNIRVFEAVKNIRALVARNIGELVARNIGELVAIKKGLIS